MVVVQSVITQPVVKEHFLRIVCVPDQVGGLRHGPILSYPVVRFFFFIIIPLSEINYENIFKLIFASDFVGVYGTNVTYHCCGHCVSKWHFIVH